MADLQAIGSRLLVGGIILRTCRRHRKPHGDSCMIAHMPRSIGQPSTASTPWWIFGVLTRMYGVLGHAGASTCKYPVNVCPAEPVDNFPGRLKTNKGGLVVHLSICNRGIFVPSSDQH